MIKRDLLWNARLAARRDILKLCLVPAGLVATRVLAGCGDKADDGGTPVGNTNGVQGGSNAAAQGGMSATQTPTVMAGTPAQPAAGAQAQAGSGQTPAGSGGSMAQPNPGGSPAMTADASMPMADAAMADPVAGPGVPWATGGTKTMTGDYPDPFMGGAAGMACTLYPSQTLGPCYANGPETRSDISDGQDGLPMRVSLRVTKSDGCTPVPDATVDVWHAGSKGVYSAFATGTICNPGTENVMADMFGRGVQVTNADGRVDFDTVFPGWYTGRSIHIHFTVTVGGRAYVTSQLYFQDTLTEEILAQGQYAARGKRDTTNATDNTFRSGGATPEEVVMETVKRPDGALHAWKLLTIS